MEKQLRLFLLQPDILFQAQVNQSSFTYPISQVTYDNSVGSYGDIERGTTITFGTVTGGRDLGTTFVGPGEASSTTIPFTRSSEGTREGEVSLVDNAFITVWNDYRVWPKTPFMDLFPSDTNFVEQYKWGVLEVGDYTTYTPPVANAGIPTAGDVDSVTGKLHVQLPHTSPNESFTTTEGATITTYAWELPAGVSLSSGFALTDPVIEVDADPGFYWIALAVVDSNGQTHQARTFILAIDPADDPTIKGIGSGTLTRTQEGQSLSLEVFEDISRYDYMDGTLGVLIEGNPDSKNDRSNVLFWGWHQTDPAGISGTREGFTRTTTLTFVDVQGRLSVLPGFPQMIENNAIRDAEAHPTITWSHMVDPTLDKFIHYLLYWHSTALEVTDYLPSGTTTTYPIGGTIGSEGGSLWDQVKRRVSAFVPKRNIGCDKYGRLVVQLNPLLADVAQRTDVVQQALSTDDINSIRWTQQRAPRFHWVNGSALKAVATLPLDENGEMYIPTFFSIAPGTTPGFGGSETSVGEQLALSQEDLNISTGHEYARLNAPESPFDIELANDWYETYYRHLDPVSMSWVTLSLEAQYAAQRGLAFIDERGQLQEVSFQFQAGREGTRRRTTIRWERETVGRPALTVIPPDSPATGDPYVPPSAPAVVVGEIGSGLRSGQETVALLTGDGFLLRTNDFQTPAGSGGPTWDAKNLGITGDIRDWVVNPFSPGYRGVSGGSIDGFIVVYQNAVDGGTDKIYKVVDIFGATPTLTELYAFPTETQDGGRSHRIMASFGRYQETEANNPWIMVVSHYGSPTAFVHSRGSFATYSTDGGQTWTESMITSNAYAGNNLTTWEDAAIYLSPKTPGLAYTFAFTNTGTPTTVGTAALYKSEDWGATWAVDSALGVAITNYLSPNIHVPWHDNDAEDIIYYTDIDYISVSENHFRLKQAISGVLSDISPTDGTRIYGAAAGVDLTVRASGAGNNFGVRCHDLNRQYMVLAGAGDETAASDGIYFGAWVSDDYGATWTNVFSPVAQTTAHPLGIAFAGDTQNELFMWGTKRLIRYSSDFGATFESKLGNINSIYTIPSTVYDVFVGIAGGPLP